WSTSINYYMLFTKIDFRDNFVKRIAFLLEMWYNKLVYLYKMQACAKFENSTATGGTFQAESDKGCAARLCGSLPRFQQFQERTIL
ncbi:MAG: hypothetical protein LUC50_06985, partial [Ruminococcus sp.]|nr:hypothetical protein [Ruminococcus sp.]